MEEYGYFDWLCDTVLLHQTHPDHTLLLKTLHKFVYTPQNDFDIRRIHKALELREYSECYVTPNTPASCLEVLVSIALDAETSVMKDSEYGNRTANWFWIMMQNLNLLQYTDYNFSKYDVEDILKKFVNRRYTKSGNGSIGFTRNRNNRKDFRKMDIWQQFNIFLTENYI